MYFDFNPFTATILRGKIGAGHAASTPPGNPNFRLGSWPIPLHDHEEGVIESRTEQEFTAEQIGWRFTVGTILIFGGYSAWSLLPLVVAADLEPSVKAALSGLIGATPFLSKVVAVALMGRPAYNLLKRTVFKWLREKWQRAT
jgi:hypothetical protein